MCPPDKVTEFFGFFSFSGKITAFAAPLAIGAVTAATGSQRLGIASSLFFLVAGLLLLLRVKRALRLTAHREPNRLGCSPTRYPIGREATWKYFRYLGTHWLTGSCHASSGDGAHVSGIAQEASH